MNRHSSQISILILGASYGLLFACRAALGGHRIDVVGRSSEIQDINSNGICVHVPSSQRGYYIEISNRTANLDIRGLSAGKVNPNDYDLIVFAMQENQFVNPEINDLAVQIAGSNVPVLSIMNMAVPPYLKRLAGVWNASLGAAYHANNLWEQFEPELFSHSCPNPQAVRANPDRPTDLTVKLPSNFKIAPFENPDHQELIQDLCRTSKTSPNLKFENATKPKVYLLASTSVYGPLAKWPMLMAGNYRCVTAGKPKSIRDTVLSNMSESESVYNTVMSLCRKLGARETDLVPFAVYLNAAKLLDEPSSIARALDHPNAKVERMDRLIAILLEINGINSRLISNISEQISKKLGAI